MLELRCQIPVDGCRTAAILPDVWREKMISISRRLFEKRCRDDSVTLAGLSQKEYDAFFKARIPYSGATETQVDLSGDAPFIATFFYCLNDALRVLKWNHPRVTLTPALQWFVTRR